MCDHHQLRTPTPAGIVDHVGSLSDNLGELVDSSEYSDLTLIVEGTSFPSHKAILAARSMYFRAMLFGGMKESLPGTTEIELKDMSATAFSYLLRYMYTSRINLLDIKEEVLLDILAMSHRYGFLELEGSISEYLKAILNKTNVCMIYDLANVYSLTSLCNVCKEFIDRNAQDILQSEAFQSLSQCSVTDLISRDSFCAPEIDIFNTVCEWAEQNVGQDPTPIINAVRLPLMSLTELLNRVRTTKLVSPDAILDAIKLQTECRDMELEYRGFLVLDDNVSSSRHSAQVIRGEMKAALLDGDCQNYDLDRGFTRHPIDDNEGQGVVIRLSQPFIVNAFKLLLWDRDMRSYSYYIEVSMDDKDYERVVDHSKYLCRSWQTMHFSPKVVRYIRIVGTHNTVNRVFHIVAFECFYTQKPFKLEQGLIVPQENVATIEASACVIEGVSRSRNTLINGDTRNYDWDSGYTCHQLGSGAIIVQLAQPYIVDSMRLLLWDCDDRSYSYYIEVSSDQRNWHMVADKHDEPCKSWQLIRFERRPVAFIKIVGTNNTANEVFHCVHFECPAEVSGAVSSMSIPRVLAAGLTNESGQQSAANSPSQQTPSSEQYASADYSPQDAPEADRMDANSSDEAED
ncbi:BTB/POZ domain-containing protein 9-like [Mizuhopecten yessoensis]|uniref:BTB/POZ domain-containing protein 9 n=1 Tax=Mizuhopecten yessoensis TaxID=6573 RepID=A0A210QUD8_MIZYE|nr:BTB/POZ domain-containing protein 9-like [Mizuhopecten yessoensis]OWF52316.1 BTB/POZ domain-containing protein 9 [Mizuhopecten yessoensis]